MYNDFIYDEKGNFYILTAFSFFNENVSIYFEHKILKAYLCLKYEQILLSQSL